MMNRRGKASRDMRGRKSLMNERNKLRNWDPSWGNQIRVPIMGDSNLVENWMNGRWKMNNQKFRAEVQKTQNLLDKTDIRRWLTIWTCFSILTGIGMKRLTVLHMRQGEREPAGTRSP